MTVVGFASDDAGTLKAMLIAERVQNERLRQIIKELQRHRFGRRAETLPEDQMLLGLEDVEQAAASGEAESDAVMRPSCCGRSTAPAGGAQGFGQAVRRRDHGAGARSRPRAHQARPVMGLRTR